MKNIWAPWRMEYILNASKQRGCLFCNKRRKKKDNKEFILVRGKKSFVLLNIYPYTNGHLMVAPYKHTAKLEDLDKEEMNEMMSLTQKAIKAIKKCMKPDGFNVGFNIGKIAGAGVKGHLHLHIVPRWEADTNFMPVIANTKVIPESLNSIYSKLKKHWQD